MKRLIAVIGLSLLLAACLSGCATTPREISNAPIATLAPEPMSTFNDGLKNSAYNLDKAISIGVLKPDDPAALCVHGVLQQLKLETAPGTSDAPPVQSFVPKVTDLLSAGSVLYIREQQLATALPALVPTLPDACDALVGKLVLRSIRAGLTEAAVKLPGGGGVLLNAIRGR